MANKNVGMLSPQEETAWTGVFVSEYILIFVINAFTIFAYARKRHLRKRTTYLIINLTMADLLVGAVTGPLSIYLGRIKPGNGFGWRQFIILIFTNIFPLASQVNLILISLERLHATLYPFRHCLVEKWFYFRIVISSWFIALLLSSVITLFHLCVEEAISYAWPSLIFIQTLLVITTSYLIVYLNVKGNPLPNYCSSALSDRKLSVTLFMVTVVSVLAILPAVIWLSIPRDIRGQLFHGRGHRIMMKVQALYYASSLVNPLIYAIRMQEFRKAVKELICKKTAGSAPVQPIELRAM